MDGPLFGLPELPTVRTYENENGKELPSLIQEEERQ